MFYTPNVSVIDTLSCVSILDATSIAFTSPTIACTISYCVQFIFLSLSNTLVVFLMFMHSFSQFASLLHWYVQSFVIHWCQSHHMVKTLVSKVVHNRCHLFDSWNLVNVKGWSMIYYAWIHPWDQNMICWSFWAFLVWPCFLWTIF
jgi:hypothetical protein